MKILFLGDIVGKGACKFIKKNLPKIIKKKKIDFIIANGENAANDGNGITKKIAIDLLKSGIDVITSGNHIWDKKDINKYLDNHRRVLRPINFFQDSPGKGFSIFQTKNKFKIGVLNLMGNIFMEKCDNVFLSAKEFLKKYKLNRDYHFLIVDFHSETIIEKMAIGHMFDGQATLVVGTHTHVPTKDERILEKGTAYVSDAGMCGDYNSVMGFNKKIFLEKLIKGKAKKNSPVEKNISLSGVIVHSNKKNGLANKVESLIYGGSLKNFY